MTTPEAYHHDYSGHDERWEIAASLDSRLPWEVMSFNSETGQCQNIMCKCFDQAEAERIAHDHNAHLRGHYDCD